MQESEPPADKRQRLLCTSAASAACSTTTGIPVGVALHESIAIAHASVRSSSIVATCKTSTLDAIFGSMLQLEGGQTSQVVKPV